MQGEVVFFVGYTVIGAFNDWNSVTGHHVYRYTVPLDLPSLSGLPVWMLLYWGILVRYVVTLARWRRLGLPPHGDEIRLGSRRWNVPAFRVGILFCLVALTRQCIYRFYAHPILSWLPFAAALALMAAIVPFGRRRWALLSSVFLIGPLVEVLYIRVGHLHAYALGWVWGVPLWIALWWVMAVAVCDDLSMRVSRYLEGRENVRAHHASWANGLSPFEWVAIVELHAVPILTRVGSRASDRRVDLMSGLPELHSEC